MKRLFALLIIFTYILMSVTAFADVYDDLYENVDIFPKEGSISADIVLENASEFDYLNIFDEYIKPFDTASILESITNSKIHLDINYKTLKNKKVVKAYVKARIESGIKLNDEIYTDTNATFHIWINNDFRDVNNPFYEITVKTPLSEKYFVVNSLSQDAFIYYPSQDRSIRIKTAVEEAMRKYSQMVFEENAFVLSLDDANFKNVMKHSVKKAFRYFYLVFNGKLNTDNEYNNSEKDVSNIMDRLKNIQILGKNGIKRKIVLGEDKLISGAELDIDLNTNIFKLHYAISGDPVPSDPGIPRPIINAKNSDLILNIKANISYNKNYAEFLFPTPNKELIHNVFQSEEYSLSYTTDKENSSPYEIIEIKNNGFLLTNENTAYIPLRSMLTALGVSDKNISYTDGVVEIYDNDAPVLPFAHIKMTVGSNNIYTDGIYTSLNYLIIKFGDTVCVPEEFVRTILGATVLGHNTTLNGSEFGYTTTTKIERLKPVYYVQLKNSSVLIN